MDLQTTWLTGCAHYEAYLCPRCGWCFLCRHKLVDMARWICEDGGHREAVQTSEDECKQLAWVSWWYSGGTGQAMGLDNIRAKYNLRGAPLNPPENMHVPDVRYEYDEETRRWKITYTQT